MDVDAYLERIGYAGSRRPDASTLRGLHLAHLRTVPFENLDVYLKRPIYLDVELLYRKIVLNRRGGLCYELNGLLAWLLEALGYRVTCFSSRAYMGDGRFNPEFDHLVLLVECAEDGSAEDGDGEPMRWLADVGWGIAHHEPLRFDDPGDQVQGALTWRLGGEGDFREVWRRRPGSDWELKHRFTLIPRRLAEFAATCDWHQHSPESEVSYKRLVAQVRGDDEVILSENHLSIICGGQHEQQVVTDEATFRALLRQHFDLDLDALP
jgi:N-hydroxyarylamine O-acetyltransferase